MNTEPRAYLLGGGIGSLAAAAFMIRDGAFSGEILRFSKLSLAGDLLPSRSKIRHFLTLSIPVVSR